MDFLAPEFRVLAADCYGSGRTLVGHSYGGAIALKIALLFPHRVKAMALFSEPTPLAAFRQLNVPVLYLLGGKSQLSAHAVAKRLVATLPDVEVVEFPQMGHMGPVTHPDAVNDVISGFLKKVLF